MNEIVKAYTSFSVNNLESAKEFYGKILGLKVTDFKRAGCDPMLLLSLEGGGEVMIYPKKDHIPATFTVLNFQVDKIEQAVKEVTDQGVSFEHYEGSDEFGISRNEGPVIAWFKDPAGNFLSFIQSEQTEIKDVIKLTHFVPTSKDVVFNYWTRPEFVEKWAFPDGMTLKIKQFEAKKGGKYCFEHTSKEGVYVCTGYFKEFIPDEKVVQVDTVKNPDGKILFSKLESIVEFTSETAGTEIHLIQKGFPDINSLKECEKAWTQSFEKLSNILLQNDLSKMNQTVKTPDQIRS
jgi:uncharacterized protein YndB with AHSA1/START domain/predicted enzyme related to lactoylglutathione lyase